jgi:hypothetical protein
MESDPDALAALLTPVETAEDIEALPPDTVGVLAAHLDDAGLARLAARVPGLRYLMTDGNAGVTDVGLAALGGLLELELLDLEYAPVTDIGLQAILGHPTLAWVDLGGTRVTAAGVADLRARRPRLELEGW